MSFDYTTLFANIGKIIGKVNSYQTMAGTTFPADRDAIDTQLGTITAGVAANRLKPLYDSGQGALVSLRQGLSGIGNILLQDQSTVLTPLSLISSDVNGVLKALYRQMVADSQTVKKCTTTIGTITYNGSNSGTGKAFVSAYLDGVTAPGTGLQPCLSYNGVLSELTVPSETITLECTADSEVDGRTEGQESWSITGGQSYPKLGWQTEGSGRGPGMMTFNQTIILANRDLATWSGSVPTSWTLTTGGAGVTKETTTVFRGTASLKFAGNASLVLAMTQPVSPSKLTARKRYLVSVAIKASGVPATGAILIQFAGTGYSAASTEKISIAAASFPTSWTIYSFWINLPTVLPSDWNLQVGITGPLSNGTNVFFDSFTMTPATFFAGVGMGVVAGSSPWLRGDRITFTLANDAAGTFQNWFRRWFGFQLPSVGGGAQTISDALAA